MTLNQLRIAHKKNADDIEIAAQLAEMELSFGKTKVAKELADSVLEKSPKHPTALYVKARLLLGAKQFEDAYALLDPLASDDDLKETKPLKLLVKMQYEAKKFDDATRTCERARKIDPNDMYWLAQLRDLYKKTEQTDKLLEIAAEVARLDPDDIGPRRLLAKHNLDLGKHAEAERYARMGLEIDVLDAECQRIIIEALNGLNRQEEADRLQKIFELR